MRIPVKALDADPVRTVTTGKVCLILAANQTHSAIITEFCAFRAVFKAILADVCTIGAGTAIGTDLNTIAAQIAVIAHVVCAAAAHLTALFAVVCRDSVTPPDLSGDTPVANTLQPVKVCLSVAFRNKL